MKLVRPSSYRKEQLAAERFNMLKNTWQLTFAWLPKRISPDHVAWLEMITRKAYHLHGVKMKFSYGPAANALTQPDTKGPPDAASNAAQQLYNPAGHGVSAAAARMYASPSFPGVQGRGNAVQSGPSYAGAQQPTVLDTGVANALNTAQRDLNTSY